MKKMILSIFVLALFLASCTRQEITSFEECVKAGNPVMESYPPKCSANGKTFTQVIDQQLKPVNPAAVSCTNAEKNAEACTLEYMPVCGDNGKTYGNKCGACASKEIESYVPGECSAEETAHVCTEEESARTGCTKEYMPVCGEYLLNTGETRYETFSNGCVACSSMKVVKYTEGACSDAGDETKYLSRDPDQCAMMGVWICDEGFGLFSDDTGCGCRPIEKQTIGGQRDEHGCLGPAGYSYDDDVGACIRVWELDEDQRRAASIAVFTVDFPVTIASVEKLDCVGCFKVTMQKNDGEERIEVILTDWKVTG